MLSKVKSAAMLGIDARPVDVEVDIASRGLPHFSLVGLPDAAVKESRDRVRAALKNSALNFPLRPITVNLAPADLKKEGASFDLPIAVGLVASEGLIKPGALAAVLITGELSLDGAIKPIRGALSMALLARALGLTLILPLENAPEAAVAEGCVVLGAESLPEVIGHLRGERQIPSVQIDIDAALRDSADYEDCFSDVRGQEHAKRALEVAAAGGHNVLMIGPPGAGKTMLAKRLATVLPPMNFDEALETTRIHSVAGLLEEGRPILGARPFRCPHHTISDVALIGGGQHPRPGEVSISHNGVLFLDELPEFKRNALEVLRQPMEGGEVTVSRAVATVRFPARFMLVAAMNPCPCGYLGDGVHECSCTTGQIHRYRARLSGPLIDRIDIHIEVPAVPYRELSEESSGEKSSTLRARVSEARDIQRRRLKGEKVFNNGQMSTRLIRKFCKMSPEARELINTALERFGLSARAYSRILKLSRTIADMEGVERIDAHHVSEAIQYRTLDRT